MEILCDENEIGGDWSIKITVYIISRKNPHAEPPGGLGDLR
jgi:hypothetical protein